jgi:hypothetical protein
MLIEAGVDLVEFGRIENTLHDEDQVKWTFPRDMAPNLESDNNYRFKILGLRMGVTPEEFHIEFEDLYVSAGLAARFWEWVERRAVPDSLVSTTMPSAWPND